VVSIVSFFFFPCAGTATAHAWCFRSDVALGAELCCPFAYGTCVIYHPRCEGYPTPTTNKYCDRRELQQLAPAYDQGECNNMKKEAWKAILDSAADVSAECDAFMLGGTRLECYVLDELVDVSP
jgi:hypothetical protein